MSINDQLEEDIHAFFENVDKQLPDARKKTLRQLIDKYAHLFSTPVLLDKYDFDMVKSHAHTFLLNRAFPKKVSGSRKTKPGDSEVRMFTPEEASTLAIIEGTISVLNGKECFRKLPKFDYRD